MVPELTGDATTLGVLVLWLVGVMILMGLTPILAGMLGYRLGWALRRRPKLRSVACVGLPPVLVSGAWWLCWSALAGVVLGSVSVLTCVVAVWWLGVRIRGASFIPRC